MKRCVSLFKVSFAAMLMVIATSSHLYAQPAAETIGGQYIPPDATATAVLNVAATLQIEAAEMYPLEIAQAWSVENIGVDVLDVDKVKLIVGVPGPSGPMGAMVIRFRRDVQLSELNDQLVAVDDPQQVDGLTCYALPGSPDLVLHVVDSRTFILSTENYLRSVVDAAAEDSVSGVLARMASAVPSSGNLTVLLAVEPVRPMINGFLQSQADEIPPPFQDFTKVPNLLEALLLQADLSDAKAGMRMVMLSRDEAAADELNQIIGQGLELASQMALQQVVSGIQGEDAVSEASRQYAMRYAKRMVEIMTPTQSGRRLTLSGAPSTAVATQGVLIGLLLPAVQAARSAAYRLSDANNLKQIGLAMHNYHSAFDKLPSDILDENGKPLLSWRVAILPFIEQQALYEAFHKDEPWDSEHNIQLLSVMPTTYQSPTVDSAPDTTVYQTPSAEAYAFPPGRSTRFRDILDGLSNTIAVITTDAANAVQWSKPSDIQLDPDDPFSFASETPGINVLFLDGAVRFLSNPMDPEMIQALLTRAGGEVVDF